MNSPSDSELVQRCLADDATAWVALTERYADLVFGIARRQGLSSDASSDVVQEVFLSLLSGLRRLKNADRLLPWIVRSARRESWRQLRRMRARRLREEAVARVNGESRAAPQDSLAEHQFQLSVREAYAALGDRCRQLLDALFLSPSKVPYAQIAADLDLAVGSIGSMRRRCLDELHAEFQRRGLIEDEAS